MQLEETGGIPTGVAPDIHGQVELSKANARQRPTIWQRNPPENLAQPIKS